MMTNKIFSTLFFGLILIFGASGFALGQSSSNDQFDSSKIKKVTLSQAEIDKIIAAFSRKETDFRKALTQYSFKREATLQTIGFGGQISGEYRRDSTFIITDKGEKVEKITFAPLPTLTDITVTPEDLDDFNGVNVFPLEPDKIPQYTFTFLGKEKIDELDLYVFDVAPKILPNPKKSKERFFQGRIWIDDKDLQIVKTKGKGVPETKQNKFPNIEIYRENIDGKYWFPTYAYSNDTLYFDDGQKVKLKVKMSYTDYKQAQTDVRILDDDTTVDEAKPTTKPTATPSPTPKKP